MLNKNTQLHVNATSNFSLATRQQSAAYEAAKMDNASNNRQRSEFAGENNSQLFFKIENKPSNFENNKFGMMIKAESEVSSAQNKGTINLDQAFIYGDSNDYGKIEIGDNVAVNQKMKVAPSNLARGNGGINGNYLKFINLPNSSQFILLAQSPIAHSGAALSGGNLNQNSILILRNNSFNGSEDATKISYFSPRFEGLQIGLSYTPSTASSVISSTVFNGKTNSFNDVLTVAANYGNSLGNLDYALSATTEQGKSNSSTQNNLSAFDVGASISYFGFRVATSYGNWGKSAQKNGTSFKNSTYKSAGISYQIGPISASITALKSSFQKNDFSATSLGLDYKLNKFFMPYLELTEFKFKTSNNTANNSGYVALGGFIISF